MSASQVPFFDTSHFILLLCEQAKVERDGEGAEEEGGGGGDGECERMNERKSADMKAKSQAKERKK